jgi:hypothetical protein
MTEIAELFARDPFDLTSDDITTIVEKLRAQRAQFNLGNKTAGKAKPKPSDMTKQAATALLDKLEIKL